MIHFSLFGIPVSIQPFFWVTLAILGNPFADTSDALLRLALFVLAGFISILVHELGHALTIRFFKVPTSITLQAFGGYATYPPGSLTRPQNFLVTAAGPLAQLGLALGGWVILNQLPPHANIDYFLAQLVFISVFWAVLNLLPVLPLDGGQLVNALLGPARIRITLGITIATSVLAVGYALSRGSFIMAIFFGMFGFQAFQAMKEIRGR